MLRESEIASGVDSSAQTTATCNVDSTTQTTSTSTADAFTQTAPLDDNLPSPTTSSLMTAAQPPSTLVTATTTSGPVSQDESFPLASHRRRHSLPAQPTAPQLTPQPLLSHPGPRRPTATSQPSTATNSATTTSKTTSRAPSSSQTTSRAASSTHIASPAQETYHQAVNYADRLSTAPPTALHAKCVVYPTDELCRPPHRQRRHRTLPTPPQLVPQPPVVHPESIAAATSSSTCLSTTAVSPALPHSEPWPTALKRRNTLPEPSEHPQALPHSPCSPQDGRKRPVSPPSASYTPTVSLMTLSTPFHTPRPLPRPSSPPVHSSSPLLDPKRAVSPPPARFNWADDAASLPTAPSSHPRDISALRTGRIQPFRTLRRRTRRRRVPPHSFIPSRQSLPPFLLQSQPLITRRHPSGIGPGKPTVIVPHGTPASAPPVSKLDWVQDPRLVNLSQALCALGWTPPC